MISQLLKIFHVNNISKLFLIFVVFSLSGMFALYASDILTAFISKFLNNNLLILFLRVISIFILYQIIVLVVAIPLGQFSYFITYQGKFIKKIRALFFTV